MGGGSYLGRLVGSSDSDDPYGKPGVRPTGQDVTIEILSGSTTEDIWSHPRRPWGRSLGTRIRGGSPQQRGRRSLRPDYAMQTVMDPNEVVACSSSDVADVYRATVIEGLKVDEILTALAEASGGYSEFETALLSGEVETSLAEIPDNPTLAHWEGLPPRYLRVRQLGRPGAFCSGSHPPWSSLWGASTGPPWRRQG